MDTGLSHDRRRPSFKLRIVPVQSIGVEWGMSETFRMQKESRDQGILGLAIVAGLIALFLLVTFTAAPPDQRYPLLALCLAVSAPLTLLFAWGLLAYAGTSLVIQEGRITYIGLRRTTCIELADVIDVQWKPGGVILLRSPRAKIAIVLVRYEPAQQRTLIRLVRRLTPAAIQRDWNWFCNRFALRLWQDPNTRPLRENEVPYTRRDLDRFFLGLGLLLAAASVLLEWRLGSPRYYLLLVVPATLWPLLRMSIPAKGGRGVRVDARVLTLVTLAFLFTLIGQALGAVIVRGPLHAKLWATAGLVALFCVFGIVVCQMERRRRRRIEAGGELAAIEWERLEAATTEPPPEK